MILSGTVALHRDSVMFHRERNAWSPGHRDNFFHRSRNVLLGTP